MTVVAAVPRVSVLMTTFNHERYIAQAIHSVLAQKTNFEVEILVGDDCSRDATRQIVEGLRDFVGSRMRLLLPERNLGFSGNAIFVELLRMARGEYIATLDGDDYWTSPLKLARQVDFLDRHPECILCFHDALVVSADGTPCPEPYVPVDLPARTSLDDLLEDNFIPSCAAVLRRAAIGDLPHWYITHPFGDWALSLLCARHGDIGFLREAMGVYRYHGGGTWSGLSPAQQLASRIEFLRLIENAFGPERAPRIRSIAGRLMQQLSTMSERRLGDEERAGE